MGYLNRNIGAYAPANIMDAPASGDGDPSAAYAVPGANGTWTKFTGATTELDAAAAAAGKLYVEFGGQTGYVPWFKRT